MAKSETSNPKRASSFDGPRYRPRWLAASFCFLIGAWLLVTLLDYFPRQSHEYQVGGQSAWNGKAWVINSMAAPQPNLGGPWGADIAWWCLHLLGVSTWAIPFFFLWFAWVAVRNARRLVVTRVFAMVLCLVTASGLAAMVVGFNESDYFTRGLGGVVGQLLYHQQLRDTVGVVGAGLLLGTIYLLALAFIFTRDISIEVERMVAGFHGWRAGLAQSAAERAERRKKNQ